MPAAHPKGSSAQKVKAIKSTASACASVNLEHEHIWTNFLLKGEHVRRTSKPSQGAVLFVGDCCCGKSSLLSSMENHETPENGCGLEYHLLDVHLDFDDANYGFQLGGIIPGESEKLPVWVLQGNEAFAPLIKHALKPTISLSRSVIVLCASLERPDAILPSLYKWTKLVDAQIRNIFDEKTITEARKIQERFWQDYIEPRESVAHKGKMQFLDPQSRLPLPENVLTYNIGAGLVIVLTKSDLAPSEKELYNVQIRVRKFCMQHGAALVYTSAKKSTNTDLLLKYVVHRVYGVPFTTEACVVVKDAVFVPAGWDSEKKLGILLGDSENGIMPFEAQTSEEHRTKEQLVEADDDQDFLERFASLRTPMRAEEGHPSEPANGRNSPLLSFFSRLLNDGDRQGSCFKTPRRDVPSSVHSLGKFCSNSSHSSDA